MLGALLFLWAHPQPARAADDFQVVKRHAQRSPYVRVVADTVVDGVRGVQTTVMDLSSGRFVQRVLAGPLSSASGFDGNSAWSADATGMPAFEGNAARRLDARAFAHFYGRAGPERARIETLPAPAGERGYRLRYAALPGSLEVTLDRTTGRVRSIVDRTGVDSTRIEYRDYRRVAGLELPFEETARSRYGIERDRVRSVAILRVLPARAFAPPPPPHDTWLEGITSVALSAIDGVPVVPIRIGNGPVLRVLLDTGSTNAMTPQAAKRSGLTLIGSGKTGGLGTGVVTQRYTTAPTLHVGAAVLRDQPFAVFSDTAFPGTDGTIGCELLQRLAVRLDMHAMRLDLARDVGAFGSATAPFAIHLAGCQPETSGAVDGIPGPLAIDTGSSAGLDVMAPAVTAHKLVQHYHARDVQVARGIGGTFRTLAARAKFVRIGPVIVRDVPIELNLPVAGTGFNTSDQLGNVGMGILGRFTIVLDYRGGAMWLLAR